MRLIFLFLIFTTSCFGLDASLEVNRFRSGQFFYLETSIRVNGKTVGYIPAEGDLSFAQINGIISVLNPSNEIVAVEKYQLTGPKVSSPKDFFDVKRIALKAGMFLVKIKLTDQADEKNRFEHEFKIEIAEAKALQISDVQFATQVVKDENSPLQKNGFVFEPFPHNVVNEAQQILHFYAEIYADSTYIGKDVVISAFVCAGYEVLDSSKVMLVKHKKVKLDKVNPLLNKFDTDPLPSGNYHLKIIVSDLKSKKLIQSYKTFITKNIAADMADWRNYNTELNNSFVQPLDSMKVRYSLMALIPNVRGGENSATITYIIEKAILPVQKMYLFRYWKDRYPEAPEAAYNKYMEVAQAVDKEYYSAVGFGFQTDRGYMYLRYGKPNKIISVDDEPNTPPYEIWYYDNLSITNQTNVRFLFYSPSLSHNDFFLLHSTCYGERRNPAWEVTLYKNANYEIADQHPLEQTSMPANWGRRAKQLFNDQ